MAKILVVDDIIDNITLLTFELQDDGHEVVALRNGQECLEQVAAIQPDLILLDIMMPVLDGMSTLKVLRGDPTTSTIPVIMVSANDDVEQVIQALDFGAHDYVSKPFVYPILAARMRSALRLRESKSLLALANQHLAKLASVDPLTETYNRRHFLERANAEFNKARRYRRPLAAIMMDVDHFKLVNDNYGHAMGDAALLQLSRVCQSLIRAEDFMGRLGGEEFAICCPETDLVGAQTMAERIRQDVKAMTITHQNAQCQITVSMGLTLLGEDDTNFDQLYHRADQLLYQAKQQGRNRIISMG